MAGTLGASGRRASWRCDLAARVAGDGGETLIAPTDYTLKQYLQKRQPVNPKPLHRNPSTLHTKKLKP